MIYTSLQNMIIAFYFIKILYIDNNYYSNQRGCKLKLFQRHLYIPKNRNVNINTIPIFKND